MRSIQGTDLQTWHPAHRPSVNLAGGAEAWWPWRSRPVVPLIESCHSQFVAYAGAGRAAHETSRFPSWDGAGLYGWPSTVTHQENNQKTGRPAHALFPHISCGKPDLISASKRIGIGTARPPLGRNLTDHQPSGAMSALDLGNGELLTEGPAIVQYLADQGAGMRVWPCPAAPFERAACRMADLHRHLAVQESPLFNSCRDGRHSSCRANPAADCL